MGSWLGNIVRIIAYWFQELITGFIKFCTKTWALAVVVSYICYVIGVFAVRGIESLISVVTGLPHQASNLAVPTGFNISYWLSVLNTFTPLDDMCQLFASYLTLALAMILYRNLKSWIPTLSGT